MKNLFGFNLLILLLLAACGHSSSAPQPHPKGSLEAILSTTQPKQTNFAYVNKIDSNLQKLVADYLSGKDLEQAAKVYGLKVNNKKAVLVDIYINDSATQASVQLTNLGMTVQSTNEAFKVVEGGLPIDLVLSAAQLDTVKAIMPVVGTGTNQINP